MTKKRKKGGARVRRQVETGFSARRPGGKGAPSLYRPGYCELATSHCLLGATNEELGEVFGVTKETIQDWMRTKPEFKAAIYEGREGADAKVASSLFHRARGYSHPEEIIKITEEGKVHRAKTTKHYPPSEAAAKFLLTNRRAALGPREPGNSWRERVEHTGDQGGPIDVTVNFVKAGAVKK
jgi:hypothetical protein